MAWLAVQARGGGGRGTPAAEAMESIAQRISMYIDPPLGEVTIEDFERFAVDRLRGDHRARSREEMLCCSVSRVRQVFKMQVLLAYLSKQQD